MKTAWLVAAALVAFAGPAHADDDLTGAIVFARGGSLIRTDPRGKGETEIATLPAKSTVRALRTDATGSVLLVDLGGTWWSMPLDGSTKDLTQLACADGPAQLAEDGAGVLCRAKGSGSLIINFWKGGTVRPIDIPTPGARLVAMGANRKLVWADANGVWASPGADKNNPKKVAPEPPLRGLLPSPDGTHALGVYADEVYVDAHHKKPADVLMIFSLDGEGARRKAIKTGVPVEWSHDSQWILIQDGASACIMKMTGGQYKCWRGYTAAAIAPDGKYALLLGNRDGSKKQAPAKADKSDKKSKKTKATAKAGKGKGKGKPAPTDDDVGSEPTMSDDGDEASGAGAGGAGSEPSNEAEQPEGADAGPAPPDVAVAPPSGPLALYRAELAGAFTTSPVLITKVVDGAAVWIPAKP